MLLLCIPIQPINIFYGWVITQKGFQFTLTRMTGLTFKIII